MTDIGATLAERGKRYGDFDNHALIAQRLKCVMQAAPNWMSLADDQREALDMIQHKIARILNGDPNYTDSWHDIAGYAKLVEDRLTAKSIAPSSNGAVPENVKSAYVKLVEEMLAPSMSAAVKKSAGSRKRRGA